jgi:hypothetical protein|tara:strand:- start:329 stop:604 length:276 start_codon:yes stop_codon:yes gene_type:complete
MTDIIRDIDPKNIGPIYKNKKMHPVWETIVVIARTASIEEIWTVPTQPLECYLPENNTKVLEHFIQRWKETKARAGTDALDFLALLNQSYV